MSGKHLSEPIAQLAFPPRRSTKRQSGAKRAARSREARRQAGRPDKRAFDGALGDAVIAALRESGVEAGPRGFSQHTVQALRDHPDLRRVLSRALSILKGNPQFKSEAVDEALRARLGADPSDGRHSVALASRETASS
jgi:hypothetical protein